jgi:hypothetical protein
MRTIVRFNSFIKKTPRRNKIEKLDFTELVDAMFKLKTG